MQPNQLNRAKLFLSYDALKGFKERIHAKERIVVKKPILSEDQLYELDWKIKQIKPGMMISVVYFDNYQYVYKEGIVTQIDLDKNNYSDIWPTKLKISWIMKINITKR